MAAPLFDPQELDGLYNRPGFMLRRCLQATGSIFGEECRDLGLTPGQYDILHILNFKAEIDQDELARALGLDRATIGAIAATLERKRLIDRQIKPTDRRKRVLTLTKAGRDIFAAAQPAAAAAQDILFSTLSETEKGQFMDLLRKIAATASPRARAPLQTKWR